MKKTTPIKHCANQRNGKCDGIMMIVKYNKDMTGGKINTWVDNDLVGKPCVVIDGSKICLYFDNIFITGIGV